MTVYLVTHCDYRASPQGVLPLGSDFPVEGKAHILAYDITFLTMFTGINPLLGFYSAVARLDVHGKSPHGSGGW